MDLRRAAERSTAGDVDRAKIDFDPADGLSSGTAVDGTSEMPGPHEKEESGDEQPGSGHGDQGR
jgi:hypothetical protein